MVSETSRLSVAPGTSTTLARYPETRGCLHPVTAVSFARAGGPPLEFDLHRAALAVPQDLQPDRVAGAHGADHVGEILVQGEALAVDGDDHVASRGNSSTLEGDLVLAGLDVRVLGRAALLDVLHQSARSDVEVETIRELRPEHERADAEIAVVDSAVVSELAQRAPDGAHGNREAHSLAATRARPDLGVDPDHPSLCVEQRAAGVAGVDRGVRLNGVADLEAGERLDAAVQGRDHADRQRL